MRGVTLQECTRLGVLMGQAHVENLEVIDW